jgi:plasmid maintenance system antidote protein VapI
MHQHRGKILEGVVRKSGYSLKALAEKLGISRNTIYNKFKEHDLSYDFIVRVGEVIHYDFTYEYPEITTTVSINKNQHVVELWQLERKYTHLLERYDKLLSFLLRLTNDYHLERPQKEIDKFLELSS